MGLTAVAGEINQFGLAHACQDLVYRSGHWLTQYRCLKALQIRLPELRCPEYLSEHRGYRCGFLDRDLLWSFRDDPTYKLPTEFLRAAFERGDECYGVLDGARQASYGWYSNRPTPICESLELRFEPSWIYIVQRFHGRGVSRPTTAWNRHVSGAGRLHGARLFRFCLLRRSQQRPIVAILLPDGVSRDRSGASDLVAWALPAPARSRLPASRLPGFRVLDGRVPSLTGKPGHISLCAHLVAEGWAP